MISVLIPNHDFDCLQLVRDLHGQLTDSGVPFEIIVVEDGSTRYLENNRKMKELPQVRYLERKENVGWFKIRSLLPTLARYPYYVCMDSDSGVVRSDYIEKYLDFARRGEEAVVVGGKVSTPEMPAPCYSLRYTYESKRESSLDHKKGFITFNYMIPASVLRKISFDDGLTLRYGHDDTAFGIKIKRLGVPIKYIDNPLVHLGLDDNRRMLQKAVSACGNLLVLHESGKYPELPQESRLLACYLKVRKWKAAWLVSAFHGLFSGLMLRNLQGLRPSMFVFDVYRLGEMLKIRGKNLACPRPPIRQNC